MFFLGIKYICLLHLYTTNATTQCFMFKLWFRVRETFPRCFAYAKRVELFRETFPRRFSYAKRTNFGFAYAKRFGWFRETLRMVWRNASDGLAKRFGWFRVRETLRMVSRTRNALDGFVKRFGWFGETLRMVWRNVSEAFLVRETYKLWFRVRETLRMVSRNASDGLAKRFGWFRVRETFRLVSRT
jgi:hypothetical protein